MMNNNNKKYPINTRRPFDAQKLERLYEIVELLKSDSVDERGRSVLLDELYSFLGNDELTDVITQAFIDALIKEEKYARQPSHEEVLRLEKIKTRLNISKSSDGSQILKKNRIPTRPLRKRIALRIAAVTIPFFFIAGGLLFQKSRSQPEIQLLATPEVVVAETIDTPQKVTLPDNTNITVSPGSKLTEPVILDDRREVELIGEAHFEVATAPEKPFIVKTDKVVITVLGTIFDVEAFPDKGITTVMLYHGSVLAEADGMNYKMRPGEMMTYNHQAGEYTVTKMFNNSAHNGFNLRDKTLREIFAIIESNYYVRFQYDGEVSGMLARRYDFEIAPDESLDLLMSVLQSMAGFEYVINGDNILITIN